MSRNNVNESDINTSFPSFLELIDVLSPSYIGEAGKYPRVSNLEDGLIFDDAQGPKGDAGTTEFIGLTDGPMSYGSNTLFLSGNTNSVVWAQPSFINLSDTPSNYGLHNQVLKAHPSGNNTIWNYLNLVDLADTPSNYGTNLQVLQTDGNSITSWANITFGQLSDVPASYTGQAGKLVKVNGNETGLIYGSSSGIGLGLNELDDFTGSTPYNSNQIGLLTTINPTSNGFNFSDLYIAQHSLPYYNAGMNKARKNYPGSQTFNYPDSDAVGGNYFYFGVWRQNYGGTGYLDEYWTTYNQCGGTYLYNNVPNILLLDILQQKEGIAQALSCGVNFYYIPSSSPYDSFYFDVEYSINSTIELGSIDDNLFFIWICPEYDMISMINNLNDQELCERADFMWYNPEGLDSGKRNYPYSVCDISLSKTFTLSTSLTQNINCFMSARNKDTYAVMSSFTVRSYNYINVSAKVLGFHKNDKSLPRNNF